MGAFKLILFLVLVSGCGAAPDASQMADALAGVSIADASPAQSHEVRAAFRIDFRPNSPRTYPNAVNLCAQSGHQLCTKDQYAAAYNTGDVENTLADPGNYWMQDYQIPGGAHRNLFQATPNFFNHQFWETTYLKEFYCCGA